MSRVPRARTSRTQTSSVGAASPRAGCALPSDTSGSPTPAALLPSLLPLSQPLAAARPLRRLVLARWDMGPGRAGFPTAPAPPSAPGQPGCLAPRLRHCSRERAQSDGKLARLLRAAAARPVRPWARLCACPDHRLGHSWADRTPPKDRTAEGKWGGAGWARPLRLGPRSRHRRAMASTRTASRWQRQPGAAGRSHTGCQWSTEEERCKSRLIYCNYRHNKKQPSFFEKKN